MFFQRLAAASLAVIMTAAIVPLAAANAAESETIVEANVTKPVTYVSYSDLRLSNPADLQELKARVRRAATNICFQNGIADLRTKMEGMSCRNDAIASAAQQIEYAVANAGNVQTAMNLAISVSRP